MVRPARGHGDGGRGRGCRLGRLLPVGPRQLEPGLGWHPVDRRSVDLPGRRRHDDRDRAARHPGHAARAAPTAEGRTGGRVTRPPLRRTGGPRRGARRAFRVRGVRSAGSQARAAPRRGAGRAHRPALRAARGLRRRAPERPQPARAAATGERRDPDLGGRLVAEHGALRAGRPLRRRRAGQTRRRTGRGAHRRRLRGDPGADRARGRRLRVRGERHHHLARRQRRRQPMARRRRHLVAGDAPPLRAQRLPARTPPRRATAPQLRTNQPRIASIAVSTARTTRMAAVARVTQRTGTTRCKRLPP